MLFNTFSAAQHDSHFLLLFLVKWQQQLACDRTLHFNPPSVFKEDVSALLTSILAHVITLCPRNVSTRERSRGSDPQQN